VEALVLERTTWTQPGDLAVVMGAGPIGIVTALSALAKPLISRTFEFRESVDAFDFALKMPPDCVKAQIHVGAEA
jgi:hypothetical protein